MNTNYEPKLPKAFNCYLDNADIVDELSDRDAGRLWKSLFYFAKTGETPDFPNSKIKIAYLYMAGQLERDFEKYRNRCLRNWENAQKLRKDAD